MRVVIAGGSGFLGNALTRHLLDNRHEVVILSRGGSGGASLNASVVSWNPNGSSGAWAREIDGADAVVNLAGAGIADKRWTPARKKLVQDSRVLGTQSLVEAIRAAKSKPSVFVQSAAIGFYGSYEDGRMTFNEESPAGKDFLAQVCVLWEGAAQPIPAMGVRLVVIRNGVVLAKHGGALARMLLPYYFLVGGPVASGRQYMSWITLRDWVRVTSWAIENPQVTGTINAVAPGSVPNKEFARAIGRALHRPSLIPVPGFVLRLMFGEMAQNMLILGQKVEPKRATALGFHFDQPEINGAMASVLT